MRILYHHRTLADGAEGIHIAEMVEAFEALGHEVRVIGTKPTPNRHEATGALHRFRHALPEAIVEGAAISYNLADGVRVSREIGRFKPHLVYKRHARYDTASAAAAHRSKVPVALEINALYSVPPYRDFEPLALPLVAARMERRALQLATVLLAVSTPLVRQVEQLSGRRAALLPNGADPRRFDAARADGARIRARYHLGEAFTIGWVGILRAWHGLDLLLDALKALPDARVLIVGDGPERAALEARAAAIGVASRLVISGRVPHAEMADHIAAMDVAAVAGERTGVASPMKLLEYMSMGRAVVAPRLENIADLVSDEATALLFDRGDTSSFVSVVSRLATDAALRARLGHAARQEIEAERNWHGNARKIIDLVEVAVSEQ